MMHILLTSYWPFLLGIVCFLYLKTYILANLLSFSICTHHLYLNLSYPVMWKFEKNHDSNINPEVMVSFAYGISWGLSSLVWKISYDPHCRAPSMHRPRLFICVEMNSCCRLESSIALAVISDNSGQSFSGRSMSVISSCHYICFC